MSARSQKRGVPDLFSESAIFVFHFDMSAGISGTPPALHRNASRSTESTTAKKKKPGIIKNIDVKSSRRAIRKARHDLKSHQLTFCSVQLKWWAANCHAVKAYRHRAANSKPRQRLSKSDQCVVMVLMTITP
jgi:hypothetical protein